MLSYIIAAESPIGRIDPSMLDDRTRMDLLISTLNEESQRLAKNADFNEEIPEDVCQWERIICDESKNIIEIDWSFADIGGEVSLDLLPEYLRWADISAFEMDVDQPKLIGTLSTALLPKPLVHLDMHCNLFYGSVDLTTLPGRMQLFYVWMNNFSGEADLSELPPTMEDLSLSRCQFSGTIDLTSLPPKLRTLSLDQNKFVGNPNLCALPASLQVLELRANNLGGKFRYSDLPASLVRLDIGNTKMSAVDTWESASMF